MTTNVTNDDNVAAYIDTELVTLYPFLTANNSALYFICIRLLHLETIHSLKQSESLAATEKEIVLSIRTFSHLSIANVAVQPPSIYFFFLRSSPWTVRPSRAPG